MAKKNKNILFLLWGLILFFWFALFSYWENTEEKYENLFQEAIDKRFPEIDKKAEKYIFNMQDKKEYCFGPNKKKPLTECVDEIEEQMGISWPFMEKYTKACDEALKEVIEAQEQKAIWAKASTTILDNIKWSCHKMVENKLFVYKSVLFDLLKQNKYQVLKDEWKKMIKKDRTKYDRVLELARMVLWNMERMAEKWPSKTKRHVF